jgi:hypothetical protein
MPPGPILIKMDCELEAVEKRIEAGIERQARYFVASPAEMAQLGSPVAAEAIAKWHGWMFVNHMNGTAYEFFEATPGQELF